MSKLSSAISAVSYSAAVKATQPLSSTLKEMAANAGWPETAVLQLSLIVKDGKLSISYPPSLSKVINDLEYGTESDPPKMVIRRFYDSLPNLMQPYFAKELEVKMGEVVGSL